MRVRVRCAPASKMVVMCLLTATLVPTRVSLLPPSRCTIDYTATLAQGLVVDYSSDKEAGPYFIADFDTRFLSPDPNTEPFMLEGGKAAGVFC